LLTVITAVSDIYNDCIGKQVVVSIIIEQAADIVEDGIDGATTIEIASL